MWGLALGLLLIFSAFVFSGMLMAMPDQKLQITPQTIAALQALKPYLHFGPTENQMYTGVLDPLERARADANFASLMDALIAGLPDNPSRSFVEREMRSVLSKFALADTEDRERAMMHCQQIFDVLGVHRRRRFFEIALYGPILGRIAAVYD